MNVRPPHNKNHLKSDRAANLGKNPAAQQDQFGSRHNADDLKAAQRKNGKPGGKSDLSFRESAQDTRVEKGARNRQPGRRQPKSGKRNRAD